MHHTSADGLQAWAVCCIVRFPAMPPPPVICMLVPRSLNATVHLAAIDKFLAVRAARSYSDALKWVQLAEECGLDAAWAAGVRCARGQLAEVLHIVCSAGLLKLKEYNHKPHGLAACACMHSCQSSGANPSCCCAGLWQQASFRCR